MGKAELDGHLWVSHHTRSQGKHLGVVHALPWGLLGRSFMNNFQLRLDLSARMGLLNDWIQVRLEAHALIPRNDNLLLYGELDQVLRPFVELVLGMSEADGVG